jgi:nucleoside-diphosphate-sugar epimerase
MIDIKDKKIVVTGGAGFIVDELLSRGANVVVIDNLSTGRKENLAEVIDRIEFFEETILNTEKITEYMKGAYAVIHQAAIPSVPKSIDLPMETHMANATGTLSVFLAARDAFVDRVVYASSSSVYGDTEVLPKIETITPHPLSPYALQKLTTEIYGRLFFSLYGLKTIGLRYFNIFGPRQNPNSEYSAVIPKFIYLMKQGKSPTINGDGSNTRDFTYVANAVHANLLALQTDSGFGDVCNIATASRISLTELVSNINELLDINVSPEFAEKRLGDIKDSFADIGKAKKILDYEPLVNFKEGLRLTADSLL